MRTLIVLLTTSPPTARDCWKNLRPLHQLPLELPPKKRPEPRIQNVLPRTHAVLQAHRASEERFLPFSCWPTAACTFLVTCRCDRLGTLMPTCELLHGERGNPPI